MRGRGEEATSTPPMGRAAAAIAAPALLQALKVTPAQSSLDGVGLAAGPVRFSDENAVRGAHANNCRDFAIRIPCLLDDATACTCEHVGAHNAARCWSTLGRHPRS